MEDEESILGAIQEEDCLEDEQDVDMFDVEEGEMVEAQTSPVKLGEIIDGTHSEVTACTISKNRKRENKKKKKKKKKSIPGSKVTDVDGLVLDVCRRLKEKKSYLVYTAVGCLGVSALCDLVKEVEAIQACGGQKIADGKRYRTGGGVLWNILKTREPNAFREIMKKGKEFEKQFRQTNKVKAVIKNDKAHQIEPSEYGNSQNPALAEAEEKRVSVHDRMRVPVRYDDLVIGDEGEEAET